MDIQGRPNPLAAAFIDPLESSDLSGFQPSPVQEPEPELKQIRKVSEAHGFPSRQSTIPRRRRTGRTFVLSLRVAPRDAKRLTTISDAHGWTYGEAFEYALDALEEKKGGSEATTSQD